MAMLVIMSHSASWCSLSVTRVHAWPLVSRNRAGGEKGQFYLTLQVSEKTK